uniref:DUF2497 domain-containing protein n=1 Tax=Desulfacinum infernum TaxID=35837 RepID=A0A832A1D7_9BACT
MKDPKKPDRKTDERAAGAGDIRDLFKGIEDLDGSVVEGEDEDVLELDEVVDDGEEGLKDLPDLEDDLTDLGDLDEAETALEEPELEESLFDEEVTVELAPAGKGLERPREPLEETAQDDETASEEDLGEPEEEMPLSDLEDMLEAEAVSAHSPQKESLDDLLAEEAMDVDDVGEPELEPEPLETEVWETDKELEALLRAAEAAEDAVPEPGLEPEVALEPEGEPEPEPEPASGKRAWDEAEPVSTEPVPMESQRPPLEPVRFDAEALGPMQKVPGGESAVPDSGDVAIFGAAAVGTAAAALAMTSTENAEEAMMEERPAMFQPIVDVLEKRLQARVQAMVQKAVAEQLPGIVRRVLQEEIERLSKSLG